MVPVTRATEADEKANEHYPVHDDWDTKIKLACRGSVGLPVGVQLAAPPWKDEVCLRAMKELETARKAGADY